MSYQMKYEYNEELDKDVLHLPLFSMYTVYTANMLRHIINVKGVNVGGKNYNNLRYADDTALLAGNEKQLPELTSKINEFGKQFGMKILMCTTVKFSDNTNISNICNIVYYMVPCTHFNRCLVIWGNTERINSPLFEMAGQ